MSRRPDPFGWGDLVAALGVVAAVAFTLALPACGVKEAVPPRVVVEMAPAAAEPERSARLVNGSADLIAYTDPDTGCQYLRVSTTGITPRIAADGRTHMGCRAAPVTPAARPAALL